MLGHVPRPPSVGSDGCAGCDALGTGPHGMRHPHAAAPGGPLGCRVTLSWHLPSPPYGRLVPLREESWREDGVRETLLPGTQVRARIYKVRPRTLQHLAAAAHAPYSGRGARRKARRSRATHARGVGGARGKGVGRLPRMCASVAAVASPRAVPVAGAARAGGPRMGQRAHPGTRDLRGAHQPRVVRGCTWLSGGTACVAHIHNRRWRVGAHDAPHRRALLYGMRCRHLCPGATSRDGRLSRFARRRTAPLRPTTCCCRWTTPRRCSASKRCAAALQGFGVRRCKHAEARA